MPEESYGTDAGEETRRSRRDPDGFIRLEHRTAVKLCEVAPVIVSCSVLQTGYF
jgi:hypothetical protein